MLQAREQKIHTLQSVTSKTRSSPSNDLISYSGHKLRDTASGFYGGWDN